VRCSGPVSIVLITVGVFPHPQLLVGPITFLCSSPEYRAVSGISNAILGAFRLRIGVTLYMLVSVENLWGYTSRAGKLSRESSS
jgi:hypothetical protein